MNNIEEKKIISEYFRGIALKGIKELKEKLGEEGYKARLVEMNRIKSEKARLKRELEIKSPLDK